MRVVAVVQARMSSTRLPGKALRPLGGRPVLGWVVRALDAASQVDEVCVATTDQASDDELADYAATLGVRVVRGPADDVLSRFVMTLEQPNPDALVRITADCPLLDPCLVDQVVAAWRQDSSCDYVATTLDRSWPRGLDVELVTVSTLRWLDEHATGYHREHVTSLLYTGTAHRLLGLTTAPSAADLRVTLDTEDDWSGLAGIVAALGDRIVPWPELVSFLRAHPEIAVLNSGVEQKRLDAG